MKLTEVKTVSLQPEPHTAVAVATVNELVRWSSPEMKGRCFRMRPAVASWIQDPEQSCILKSTLASVSSD